jgi:hypothetical protein
VASRRTGRDEARKLTRTRPMKRRAMARILPLGFMGRRKKLGVESRE